MRADRKAGFGMLPTTFIKAVCERAACQDRDLVEASARITVRALGSQLARPYPPLHSVLPESLHAELSAGAKQPPCRPDDVYATVADRQEVRIGIAAEIVQSIVAEVSARLLPAQRSEARQILPPDWAQLVVEPIVQHGDAKASAPPPRSQLFQGRPGSRHPIADAEPSRGFEQSVANSDDPHAETRLSSTRGVSSERRGRTLARGRPDDR
jgi:hypothetical protein